MTRLFHCRAALVALASVTLTVATPAVTVQQTPPPQTPPATPQRPVFGTRIDAVSVDVIVTDRQGKPVLDLKAEDFEVKENGKLQKVDLFKLVLIDDAMDVDPSRTPEIRSLSDMERETARDDVRVIVIFLDDYHVRLINSMRVREQIARFVGGLNRRDLVALMYPLTPVNALTFSRNHESTARAILGFVGRKYDYTPKSPVEEQHIYYGPAQIEQLRNRLTTSALESLCAYLGTLRDHRKTVLFVSEGLQSVLPTGVSTTGSMQGLGRTAAAPGADAMRDSTQFFNSLRMMDLFRDVFVAAGRANASIYTLDPRGLASSEYDMSDRVDTETDRRLFNESLDTLRMVAGETDGRAIVSRNDPAPALQQMLRDTSAYYLLSYTSTETARDGKFHPIKVAVSRKNVDVRARSGYWAYTTEDLARASTPAEGPPAAVTRAFDGIAAPARGRAVRTWFGSARGPDGRTLVMLAWESLGASEGASALAADRVSVIATSASGQQVYRGRVAKAGAGGQVSFPAPPGTLRVRIAAEGAGGEILDTEEREIAVPDFTSTGPTLSTAVVYRARTARDIQQLRAAVAPLPSTGRQFSRTERFLLRFEAYGPGGTTPEVTLRLLNRLGKTMATLPAPTRTPSGILEADIGLGQLPPGDYLIEIVAAATDGATVQQLIAFQVTG